MNLRDPADAALGSEIALLREAVAAAPDIGDLHILLAASLAGAGERDAAIAELRAGIELGTTEEAISGLATLLLTGPDYRAQIAGLHALLRPAVYVEIGVFRGETLALARPPTRAFAVDPSPLPESDRAYAAQTVIRRETSDAFFAALDDGTAALPGPVDFAFIDGLHLFEQVLRDFINVERHANGGAVAMFHDTMPVVADAAARERHTSFWCGDVWKVVPALRQWRPDLRMTTIPAPPSGITIVCGLDPRSRVLADHFDEIVARYMDFDFAEARVAFDASLATPNDPAWAARWLLDAFRSLAATARP